MLLEVEIKMIYENGTMGTLNLNIDYDRCGVTLYQKFFWQND